jgi:hypothetical protein
LQYNNNNMATKKVSLTVTRYYSKQTSIEIEVDENLKDDELINFLTNDKDLDNQIEEGLGDSTLNGDETKYEWYDEKESVGGHL